MSILYELNTYEGILYSISLLLGTGIVLINVIYSINTIENKEHHVNVIHIIAMFVLALASFLKLPYFKNKNLARIISYFWAFGFLLSGILYLISHIKYNNNSKFSDSINLESTFPINEDNSLVCQTNTCNTDLFDTHPTWKGKKFQIRLSSNIDMGGASNIDMGGATTTQSGRLSSTLTNYSNDNLGNSISIFYFDNNNVPVIEKFMITQRHKTNPNLFDSSMINILNLSDLFDRNKFDFAKPDELYNFIKGIKKIYIRINSN